MADGRKRKFVRELCEKARVRRESGLYVVDGCRMCSELPLSEAEEVFVTKSFLASPQAENCAPLLQSCGYDTVTDAEMKQMSDTVSPQGILALARQKKFRGLSAFLEASDQTPLYLILEDIRDPGNLGTMLRTAEASGASGVLMNRDCVDIYAPKVVRSTMGAMFRVPFYVVDELCEALSRMREGIGNGQALRVFAAHLDGSLDYASVSYRGPSAVMIGNEAHGLSDRLAALADERILIPMCGQVESLNAAMAATIVLFEAARQRRCL